MYKNIFAIILVFSFSVSAATFPLSSKVYTKVPFVENTIPKPFGSFLTMNIKFEPVQELFYKLDNSLKGILNKQNRRIESHITVITPVEFDNVLKKHLTIQEINKIAKDMDIQSSGLGIVCLGEARSIVNNRYEYTYYLVVYSPNLLNIRKAIYQKFLSKGGHPSNFDPDNFYPHITVGYTLDDLHLESNFVYKNKNSCRANIKLI